MLIPFPRMHRISLRPARPRSCGGARTRPSARTCRFHGPAIVGGAFQADKHQFGLAKGVTVIGPMSRQLASNEHLDYVAALLDDMFRIPGTKIRFGLDALIGWVPGIGDAMTGIASFLIVFASWRRGAKAVTLVRMIANVLLETAIGAIPVAGDVFHIVWKANRRNYRLLLREKEQPGVGARRDWMFLGVLFLAVITAAAIPIAILIWLLRSQITFHLPG